MSTSFPRADDEKFVAALMELKRAGCDVSINTLEGGNTGDGLYRHATVAWTTHNHNGRLLG